MLKMSTKREQDWAWLGGKGNPLRIVQEIKIWTYNQMVFALTRIRPRERDT